MNSIQFVSFEPASKLTRNSFLPREAVPDGEEFRLISDVVRDLYYHALEIVTVAFLQRGQLPRVVIRDVRAACFECSLGIATKWTAARIDSDVYVADDPPLEFCARIVKDAPADEEAKYLKFPGAGQIDLSGGRWTPHYAVFSQLFARPQRVRFELHHHALVSAVCEAASHNARRMENYEFGAGLPPWLLF